MDGVGEFDGLTAALVAWFSALGIVIFQGYTLYDLFSSELTVFRDAETYYYWWATESSLGWGSNFLLVIVGMIANLGQMTLQLRKWFSLAVNVQGFAFLFGTWIFLCVVGYWTYFWEEYEADSK